jgi:putative SOS response-associated peptidase YedK
MVDPPDGTETMCGRFVQSSPPEQLAQQFAAVDVTGIPHSARFNVAPSTTVRAIIDAGGRRLGHLRWGFVPSWSKDPATGPRPINARVEGVATSRLFAAPLRRQRCIVPLDGWYEWRGTSDGKDPSLLTAADGRPMAVAALWSTWRDREGADDSAVLSTVTLLTTEAIGEAATVHHRMPLGVPAGLLDDWLVADPVEDVTGLLATLVSTPIAVRVQRVGRRVNDVRNDDPSLLEPV